MSTVLPLLHLCDSLFPIGGFSHSDGLESATASGRVGSVADLRSWMRAYLNETLCRCDGPSVRIAWEGFGPAAWEAVWRADEELNALRPSAAARAASRAMGTRLLKTAHRLRPHPALAGLMEQMGESGVTLPVAFGVVCAAAGIGLRETLEGFLYTRLVAVVSSAMRLMALGQHDAHALLVEMLAESPSVVDDVLDRRDGPAQFAPALDLAAMCQQYVHSRLFTS